MQGLADALEYGTVKYEAWSWVPGWTFHRPYASILRHMFAWFKREEFDPETKENLTKWAEEGDEAAKGLLDRNPDGLRHLDMAATQLMFLCRLTHHDKYKNLDDRPRLP